MTGEVFTEPILLGIKCFIQFHIRVISIDMIIVNADDWGRSIEETEAALNCYLLGRMTSVTAMVFMADSERAATLSLKHGIPTGLHINFSQTFSASISDKRLSQQHGRIVRFLSRSRYCQLLYNPFLRKAFHDAFQAQVNEFVRLYRKAPTHFDGHQHMHLCANMMLSLPIPPGEKVRRSFSFEAGEKSIVNRRFRALVDRRLGARYKLTEFFFDLSQRLDDRKFDRVCDLARHGNVELMTHPVMPLQHDFLTSARFVDALKYVSTGSYLEL